MTKEIIISGFGGQGVILAGKLLAYAGMLEGKYVSFIPSYGAEMRGGTASCAVIISNKEIGSPLISNPTHLVVLNEPSLHKYILKVRDGGVLIINSSMVNSAINRNSINIFHIPCNKIAEDKGSLKSANLAALGALVNKGKVLHLEALLTASEKYFTKKGKSVIDLNSSVLSSGYNYNL